MNLIVLTGASGSGKTAIADAIDSGFRQDIDVHRFDTIGVPPTETMITAYGSPEMWQRAMTFQWMRRLSRLLAVERMVLFEGQMRPSFIVDAARAAAIDDYRVVLVDCDDRTRRRRLCIDRAQPELVNDDMMAWAAYLRREASSAGCAVVDTSRLSLQDGVEAILAMFAR
ncbi:MAG: hypothetical protein ABW169_02345 [Sphingobium sp.]|jgi:hypothetical protein